MGRKLRILEVNKAYFPHVGGIETLVEQYSRELGNTSSVSVKTLVCRDGRGGTVRERLNGVDLTLAGSLGTYFSCPLSLSFLRLSAVIFLLMMSVCVKNMFLLLSFLNFIFRFAIYL